MAGLFDQFLTDLKVLERSHAEPLFAFLEEATAKLGIQEPVRILTSSSTQPNAMYLPTKLSKNPKPVANIVLTEGMINLMNEGQSISNHASKELKAIIGHELSHVKDGFHYNNYARSLPICALPLAFSVGYYLLDKTFRTPENENKTLKEQLGALKETIGKEKQALLTDTESLSSDAIRKAEAYDNVLRMGGTVAAAAVGLVAGLGVSRHMSMRGEFRADRAGAWLTDAKAMSSALEKTLTEFHKPFNQTFTLQMQPAKNTLFEGLQASLARMKNYLNQEVQTLQAETVAYHPNLAERTKNLSKFAPGDKTFADAVAKSARSSLHYLSL